MRLGRVKQAIFIVVFLHISASALGQAGKSFKFQLNGNLQDNHVIYENQSIRINYSLSELEITSFENETGSFYRVAIPGHYNSVNPGKPELPVFSRLIEVPEGSEYEIRIYNVVKSKLKPGARGFRGMVYPAQEGLTKSFQQDREKQKFVFDRTAYSSDEYIGSDTVRIENLGKARSKNLANIYISPVRYNPKSNTLEVITSMSIEVTFSKSPEPGVSESLLFEETVNKGLLNYSPSDVVPGYSDQPVKMIILTDTAFKKQLEPFIKWKTQKGLRVSVLYRGTGLAGNTYAQLKDTLAKIYRSSSQTDPPPEYLLIIGDVNRIPTFFNATYATDLYYGEFDGDGDFIPEMFIGRLPAADTAEVRSVLTKIIQYEKFGFEKNNVFYSNALAFAGEEPAFANTMNGQVRYVINNYLTKANRIDERHFYYPHNSLTATKDSIIKLINKGLSFINYTGHGDASGLLHINLKTPDIPSFQNKNMYPFFISNACQTGKFDNAASFGNKMLVTKEKGAIGFIGCSWDSYWDEDFYWAVGVGDISQNPTYQGTGLGAMDRLFHTHGEQASDWYYTMGQVNFAGNLAVSTSSSKWKKYYWETYNLIGDPSVIPILGKPENFNVTLPDTLPNGIKSFSFNVDPFAYVAFSHSDTLWDASFASPSGSVVLDLPGISNNSGLLVITGQNKYPIIKKVYFSKIKGEYLNLSKTEINDIQGNKNNRADFGETFYLAINIRNLGLTPAEGLYATISTKSDWATIESDSVYIGTLDPVSEIALLDNFVMTISEDVPDLGFIPVVLTLKDIKTIKQYTIDIPVHAPELQIISCLLDDRGTGNGDYVADPGETFDLVFRISNDGSSNTSGQFLVSSLIPSLTILQPSVKSGEIKFGEMTDIRIQVKLSNDVQAGSYFAVSSDLICDPYAITKSFSFRAGKIRESFETSTFLVFPWINASTVPWIITDNTSSDGTFSARSGAISNDKSTILSIRSIYENPDTLKFQYKVSSEQNYDNLTFKLNDKLILKKSGEVAWTRMKVPVPAGINILEWSYTKDKSVFQGSDCAWIDLIDFAGTGSVRYIGKDIQVSGLESPVDKEKYGQETITVRVRNHSNTALNGFNLAFTVNGGAQVKQFFNTVIPFNDSVTVSFTNKANLSKYGKYDIRVFGTDNSDDYLVNDTTKTIIEHLMLSEGLTVFPNPFNDELTVFIQSPGADNVELALTNYSGMKVYITKRNIVSGNNTLVINDFNLAPGTYYLTIRGETINRTYPLIKVR